MRLAYKVIIGLGAIAAAIAAILGLYWSLVRTSALSVKLDQVTAQWAETLNADITFSNTGETSVSVVGIDSFFSSSENCIGQRIARVITDQPSNGSSLVLESGNQSQLRIRLEPMFQKPQRVTLCMSFETNFGTQTEQSSPIPLHSFSVDYLGSDRLEFDGKSLDQVWHSISGGSAWRPF